MTNETYNGWTNYITWKINLEFFDGFEAEEIVTGLDLQMMVEEHIEENSEDFFVNDLACIALEGVNWDEIATHINEGVA